MALTYSHAGTEHQALNAGTEGTVPSFPHSPKWVFSEWLSVYPLI